VAKVTERLTHDLHHAFPDMKGFSARNLKYMRAFAEAWPDEAFVQEVLAQWPRYHLLALLDKLADGAARRWYAAKAIEHGWSRNVLVMQIETGPQTRSGQAVTNFARRPPAPQSDLARESLKDPCRFDCLGLGEAAQERDIEGALVQHMRFAFDLTALRGLDDTLFENCMAVRRMAARVSAREVHACFSDGSSVWRMCRRPRCICDAPLRLDRGHSSRIFRGATVVFERPEVCAAAPATWTIRCQEVIYSHKRKSNPFGWFHATQATHAT
jgi:predicted nuclease of restriction endonuclease-like (RecB) superfamily